jgi:hypothetical protein
MIRAEAAGQWRIAKELYANIRFHLFTDTPYAKALQEKLEQKKHLGSVYGLVGEVAFLRTLRSIGNDVRLSNEYEDSTLGIDAFVNGVPIQVKTNGFYRDLRPRIFSNPLDLYNFTLLNVPEEMKLSGQEKHINDLIRIQLRDGVYNDQETQRIYEELLTNCSRPKLKQWIVKIRAYFKFVELKKRHADAYTVFVHRESIDWQECMIREDAILRA